MQEVVKERLLEKGEEQGYLALEDILQEYPDAEAHIEEIGDLYSLLEREGIPVIGAEEAVEKPGPSDGEMEAVIGLEDPRDSRFENLCPCLDSDRVLVC